METNKLRIRPFKPEDYYNFMETVRNLDETTSDLGQLLEYYNPNIGPAYSGFINDKLMFSIGFSVIWPGCAFSWMFTTQLVEVYTKEYIAAIKSILQITLDGLKLRRLEVHVPAYLPKFITFAEKFGFEHEGDMRNYGPLGSTYARYAIIREVE